MSGRSNVVLVCIFLFIGGCREQSDYDRLVKRELAKGETHNTLFLGYELGMSRDAFYDHSWDLNRQGLVMQGPNNQTVQYELHDELPHSAKMNFYPDFFEETVFQMRVRFIYDGWSPWTRNLAADSLQTDVLELFRKWYGDGFIQQAGKDSGSREGIHYVKVDGNRRIIISKYSESEVAAVFTDLIMENRLKELEKASETHDEKL